MKKFATADLHDFHNNIIKYCSRPFKDVFHMRETLITNWNAKVTAKDLVFVLGDVTSIKNASEIEGFMHRLNGMKILIYGNHDKALRHPKKPCGFHERVEYLETSINDGTIDRTLVMFHYPIFAWNKRHHGAWHIYGHSHGMSVESMNTLGPGSWDVGVDVNNYAPISFSELATKIKTTYPEWPPKA